MADVHREINCSICTEKDIRWKHFACLVCPNYYLCIKCYDEKFYSKPHRPYHPMQQRLSEQEFYKFANSITPPEFVITLCCPYCGIMKGTIAELLLHCKQKHDGDGDCVRCPVCIMFGIPRQGLQHDQFIEHLRNYHEERGQHLNCDACGDRIILGSRYTCLICNLYDLCDTCHKTKRHNQNHMPYHPMQEVLPKRVFSGQTLNIYWCPFCGESKFNPPTLADHCQKLHAESQAVRVRCPICSVCRIPFQECHLLKDTLLDHLKNYHGILPKANHQLPEPEADLVECSICLSELVADDPTAKNYFQCLHKEFHERCIQAWMSKQANCPVCRSNRLN